MNVEDEYFSVIENRDTEIMLKDKQLAEKDELLATQSEQLAAQNEQLAAQDEQLAAQQTLLRMSVKMLIDAGMTPEDIAANMNMDFDTVRRLLE